MPKRQKLILSSEDEQELNRIGRSRTDPMAMVLRSKILLFYNQGMRISEIARELRTTRPLIERCIDKALTFGPSKALKDLPRPGAPSLITDDAKTWVLSLACRKPTDLGYAHETWTYSLLIGHIRKHCEQEGHSCLAKIGKGRLHSILKKGHIQPHKIKYYLERRDPDFDTKMANVLHVYKEVEIANISNGEQTSVTVSFDEKPGIQALQNVVADLLPTPNQHPAHGRDHQYKRLGTVSLLAGIDLHGGQVIPLVKDRHRSKEFVEFLDLLDQTYPKDWTIRLILDNHSAHISKETQKYLKTKLGRFDFVFTPKHGSWLNLIEVFFSKIARSFLRHIRVNSKQELIERIYRGIAQINKEPVVFRWRYKMDEIAIA